MLDQLHYTCQGCLPRWFQLTRQFGTKQLKHHIAIPPALREDTIPAPCMLGGVWLPAFLLPQMPLPVLLLLLSLLLLDSGVVQWYA